MSGSFSSLMPPAPNWDQWLQGGSTQPTLGATPAPAPQPAPVAPPPAQPPIQPPGGYDPTQGGTTVDPSVGNIGPAIGSALGSAYDWLKRQPSPITGQVPPGAQPPAPPPQEAPQAPLPEPPVPPPGGPPALPPVDQTPPQAAPQAAPPRPTVPIPVNPQQAVPDVAQGDQGTLNIKRNNPLNIRYANQPGATDAGGFAQFPTVQDGYNAATTLMGKYADSGITTLSGLITKWAPPSENNTAAYIATVSKATGIDPNAQIDLHNPAIVGRITPVMARVESGTGGGGGAPAPGPTPSPMLAGTTTQPAPGQPGTGDVGGNMLSDYLPGGKLPYSPEDLQMPRSNQLLALAGGILSGHSLGDGLGRGFQAMNTTQMADLANKRAINAQALQLANVGVMANYRNLMGQNAAARIEQGNNTPAGPQQIIKNQDGSVTYRTPMKDGSFRMDQGPSGAVQGEQNRNDANVQAGIKGAVAGATDAARDTQDDINEMYEGAADAQTRVPQIAAMRQLVNSGQVATGPGLNQLKRNLSNFFNVDLGSDPTQTQLTAAAASQLRGTSAFAKNMRNVKEFNSLMEGLPGTDLQNPQAMGRLLNGVENMNNLKLQTGQDWQALPQAQRQAMRSNQDAYQSWFQGEVGKWRQGVEKNGGFYGGQNASAPQAGGPATGKPTVRYDQASGRMVPM